MSIKESLASLQIPELRDTQSVLKATGAAGATTPGSIKISGVLVGQTPDMILLSTVGAVYQISVESLLSVDKDVSQPSKDQLGGGVAVVISVTPTTELIEMRTVRAASIGSNVGMRPLVYALPSGAEQYAAVDYPNRPGFVSSTMNSGSPYSSPYTTHWSSGTVQDNTTDYRIDFD